MTVLVTRPNETKSSSGATLTGGATAWQVASDLDTGTYYELDTDGDEVFNGVAEPTIPAGARVIGIVFKIMCRKVGSDDPHIGAGLSPDNTTFFGPFISTITWTSPVTIVAAALNPIQVWIWAQSVTDIVTLINDRQNRTVRVMEEFFETTYVAKPALNVNGPTGTITDTNPFVPWDATLDGDGGTQTKYEARVFTDAQYGAGGFDPATSNAYDESGVIESDNSYWQLDNALLDDTYRAYVRIAQTTGYEGDFWSDWDYSEFTVDAARPGTPTLVVDGQASYGRNRLTITGTSGEHATEFYEAQRSTDGGATWLPVRTLEGDEVVTKTGTSDIVYDYESSNGLPSSYRVRAGYVSAGDLNVYSDWSTEETGVWASEAFWIKHPTRPDLNLSATLRSQPTSTRAGRQTAMQVLGSRYPTVVADVRPAPTGELIVRSGSDDERDRLDALLDGNTVGYLIQGRASDQAFPDRWVSIDEFSRERAVDSSWGAYTFDSIPWTEISRPSGEVVAWVDPVPSGDDLLIV